MKIVSWNVNGLRACIKKGFWDFFNNIDADIFCVQEIKMCPEQFEYIIPGYTLYWHAAEKKGYAGTVIFSKIPAKNVTYGLNFSYTDEGRVITLEFENFYLVNCYAPHSQRDLNHLLYKDQFNTALITYISQLQKEKAVILCGDLNVAHKEIDLANFKGNVGNAGFTALERKAFDQLLALDMIDSYRFFFPCREGAYTWWSYRKDVRARNIGWRIDYFLISNQLQNVLLNSTILPEIYGSDHCPISIDIAL